MAEEDWLAQPENGGGEDIFALKIDLPKLGEDGADDAASPTDEVGGCSLTPGLPLLDPGKVVLGDSA